jgi:translation initiation factor 1
VDKPRRAPEVQTAHIRREKRAHGRVVTVVSNLDPEDNDLASLAAQLKTRCGAGGTVKDGLIEIQGDHVATVQTALRELGYKTKS